MSKRTKHKNTKNKNCFKVWFSENLYKTITKKEKEAEI